jgi:hypothetical protein
MPSRILPVHAVAVLALPAMDAFDLAIPAQVFADPGLPRRYEFTVCAPTAGLVRSTRDFPYPLPRSWDGGRGPSRPRRPLSGPFSLPSLRAKTGPVQGT